VHTFPPSPKLQFHGKVQSMFTMTRFQKEPEFKLTIETPHFLFFTKKKTFTIRINHSQGSWLIAGLNYWHGRKDAASADQS
jgi:hypothetical protein